MGRIVPQAGITYYDANMGCLVTEGPDVADYKTRLREIDPTISAYYDKGQEEWIVTFWDDKKNQDTFLLSDVDLARAYERVQRARNDRPGALTAEQLNRKLEREQDQQEKDDMRAFHDIAGDAAERLTHALEKDGFFDHEDIYGPRPRPALSAKADSIRDRRP